MSRRPSLHPAVLHLRGLTAGVLLLALPVVLGACTDRTVRAAEATDVSPDAAVRSLGTVEATLDGERQVWHVVEGQASDGPYASGIWFQLPDGPVAVVLGGFDSADPPIETFSRGGGGSPASVGEYRGSSLSLQVQLPSGGSPARFSLPADEGRAMVVFTPVFDAEDMSGLLAMASGEVEVVEASLAGETMALRGTFSGRLEPMGGGDPVTVTEGRFEVREIPSAESIQPGG